MKKLLTFICCCILISSAAIAAPSPTKVSANDERHVSEALAKLSKVAGRHFTLDDVQPSPIPGLLQVTTESAIVYITNDGRYLLSGELLDLTKDSQDWSLTEQAMRKVRKGILASLDTKDMIIFPSTAKKQLGIVYVFTDVDCQYCHKLQDNIKAYTDAGIEIRYLAFPRQGPKSKSFKKTVTIWCAKDRKAEYTAAMNTKDLPENICASNPVEAQFALGRQLGVTGTPTMFLANGAKAVGLVSPEDLSKFIKMQTN